MLNSFSFRPDSGELATAGADGKVRLWNTTSWQHGTPGTLGDDLVPYTVQYSPDGKALTVIGGPSLDAVSSGKAKPPYRYLLVRWDLINSDASLVQMTYKINDASKDPYPSGEVAFSPDGSLIAVPLSNGRIELREARTGDLIHTLDGHHGSVTTVAFNKDGTMLASGGTDRNLRLWDVATRKQIGAALSGHNGSIRGLAFLPNGGTLASISDYDISLRLWDVSAHRFLAAVRVSGSSNGLAVQSGTGLIAMADAYSQVSIVDPDLNRVVSDACSAFRGSQPVAEAWEATGNDPDQAPRC